MNRNPQNSTAVMAAILSAGAALVLPTASAQPPLGIDLARKPRPIKKIGVDVRYAKPVPEGPHITLRPVAKAAAFGPDHPIRRRVANWEKKEATNVA